MSNIIIYEGDDDEQELVIIDQVQQAMEMDAAFLATWLHGKAEKTQQAYAAV